MAHKRNKSACYVKTATRAGKLKFGGLKHDLDNSLFHLVSGSCATSWRSDAVFLVMVAVKRRVKVTATILFLPALIAALWLIDASAFKRRADA